VLASDIRKIIDQSTRVPRHPREWDRGLLQLGAIPKDISRHSTAKMAHNFDFLAGNCSLMGVKFALLPKAPICLKAEIKTQTVWYPSQGEDANSGSPISQNP
jgi:hypothetical protein